MSFLNLAAVVCRYLCVFFKLSFEEKGMVYVLSLRDLLIFKVSIRLQKYTMVHWVLLDLTKIIKRSFLKTF